MRGYLQGAALARRIVACATVVIAVSFAAAGLFGAAQPAAAQQGFGNYFGYQTHKRHKRRAVRHRRRSSSKQHTAEKKKETKKATKPSGPVYIVVSLGDQHISVYDRTGRIARSVISTGRAGHRTPAGVFSVIGKERYHYSNLYGAAPMPWMQRITWSGVAMHAGYVTGRPASHGCIRLPYSFAPKLWKMTKMGARVVVARKDTVPFEISNPFLPLPTMRPAPGIAQQASRTPRSRIELASMSTPSSVAMTTSDPSEEAGNELLNPIAYAAALKKRAKADKKAAAQAAKKALADAQAAGVEARQAVGDIEKAKADLETAKAKLAVLEGAPSAPLRAKTADTGSAAAAEAALETARIAARSQLIKARAALEEAQRREAIKTPAAFRAVQVWKDSVAAKKAAVKTLKEAERRSEPVSMLVSRKEGRVFIRQDWKQVYEAPVTIRDPDRPLGTHVYIAVGAKPDGSAMRWQAISLPPERLRPKHRGKKRRAKNAPELPIAKTDDSGPETAAGALDRIELPPEARKRMSELLWTGASLIVSDHPRSYEMDDDTGFIVLTR